jgi:N-acetylmuramoyl-L-alanine amidase
LLGVIFGFEESAASNGLAGIKVCLDPGHGGADPGAVNALFELEEKEINLDVSYGLKSLLEEEGAQVVMTRTEDGSEDEYLTNSDRYTFCNEEQATILISVHTNSVVDPTWDGSMVLYGPRESPDLAQAIYDEMFPFLRDTAPQGVEEFIGFGVDRFASGVLFKSDMPAAMVEPLFMSHPAEALLLVKPIFSDGALNSDSCANFSCRRGQIARTIFSGTLAYFDDQTGGAMHVSTIDMSYEQKRSNYFIDTVVSIQDASDKPVPSAEVLIQIKYPDGDIFEYSAVTGDDGAATLRIKTRMTGTYKSSVVDILKTDWFYDSNANIEDNERLTIP